MRTILAIDQSTSATKALLFAETGELLEKTAVAHEQIYPQPGWVEHDAEQIFRNTCAAAAALLSSKKVNKKNLVGVSITNQRETFVVFDRASGEPLYNAIVWQCRRGEEICRILREAGHEAMVQQRTGLKIDTYFPASKIRWLLENQPDIRQKLLAGSALLGTIDAYLIYRLTGGRVFATDQTNASRTLLFDINTLDWDEELCDLFDVPRRALPEVYDSSARFGETDFAGLLEKPLPITGVMGDSQAALFAQRCFAPGGAKVTFGTGSSVLLNIGHEKRLSTRGNVTALAWVLQGQPTYAFEGIINFTGATIAWMRDQMQLITNPAETETLARSVSSSDGVYLIPAFVGLSAPYWRADARAAIVGMTPSTTRAHIVRAALESIGYIVTDVLKAMSEEAGVNLSSIYADGGAVRNAFLMQFVADMNQLKLRAAQIPELSSLGAVFNGCLGLKIYTSLNDLQQLPFDFVEYKSAMEPERADILFAGWKAAVQQVLYQPNLG